MKKQNKSNIVREYHHASRMNRKQIEHYRNSMPIGYHTIRSKRYWLYSIEPAHDDSNVCDELVAVWSADNEGTVRSTLVKVDNKGQEFIFCNMNRIYISEFFGVKADRPKAGRPRVKPLVIKPRTVTIKFIDGKIVVVKK